MMYRSFFRLTGVGLLIFLLTNTLPAQAAGPTGKIAGRATDVAGAPLPGVNVIIVGTTHGAITDIDGYYHILNVKPGNHIIQASFIGFATVRVERVKVVVDKTTKIDFTLSEEVIRGEEIVVTAERPIVEMDRTTTTAVVDAEQLEALPVTRLSEAINLQAGVVDGHFRGGRSGEVSYLVNGVPINNAFNNQAAFEIEQNMVASLEVISGVFNAEYGQAQSGVVNIVTKDVPEKWAGSFLGYVGAIASDRDLEFVDRTIEPGAGLIADYFASEEVPYYEAAAFPNLKDLQISFGGPLIRNKLGIQVSGRFLDDNSHFIGRDLFSPDDVSIGLNSGQPRDTWVLESTGDGKFFPLNTTERLSLNGSVNYNFTPKFRLDYNVFLQDGVFRPFSHSRKYVPRGINETLFLNQTHIMGLHLTMGSNAFANLSYSFLRDKTDVQLYDSPFDERYVRQEQDNLHGVNAFRVAGNQLSTSDLLTQTHTVVADYTVQATRVHLVKTGVQTRIHSLDNHTFGIERSFRTDDKPQPSPDKFNDDFLKTNPFELSAYVQDKMEFESLIVNAGLRFDYFDSDYLIPIDWSQAELVDIPDPANPTQRLSNRIKAKPEFQFSPRLGIAFPISSVGVMRFSAGMFFQIPPFSLLYTNPEYEINPQSSSNQFGNAGISPERTLSFEIGLQQGLTDNIGLELTIFSKDVRNLTGQEILRNPNGDFAVRWINRDYGTIRGLTFSLFQRPSGPVSWTLDYTLQFAEGTASGPGEAFGRQQSGLEEILSLVRLNWDRRHVLNNTLTVVPANGLSITFINRLQSGTPYTTIRNFIRSNEKNNAAKPSFFSSDVRIFYKPAFIGPNVQLFLQVKNLTDSRQIRNVYADTGEPDESVTKELFRRTGGDIGGINSLDEFFFRQEFFGAPRKISLGLNYRF